MMKSQGMTLTALEQPGLSEDFFKRFLLQGKLISQIITFWWRYSDDESATQSQQDAAQHLGQCFYPQFKYPSGNAKSSHDSLYTPNLIDLFSANPRKYIDSNYPKSVDSTLDNDSNGSNVKTLITVFGEDRIYNKPEQYLSPIFSSTELDDNEGAFYSFVIDSSGTKFGKLTDPELRIAKGTDTQRTVKEYRYHIPIPPCHPIPQDIWESWIKDNEEGHLYPPSPHIPFTT